MDSNPLSALFEAGASGAIVGVGIGLLVALGLFLKSIKDKIKAIISFCLIIIVLMILFPPWIMQWQHGSRQILVKRDLGYHYLFEPPRRVAVIDYEFLALQIVGVVAICALLALFFGNGKRTRDIIKESQNEKKME